MREIDISKDNSEARLSRALRTLSAASAAGAPRQIGDALAATFRRHHARRRAWRRAALASSILGVILAAAVPMVKRNPDRPTATKTPATITVSPAETKQASAATRASTKRPLVGKRRAASFTRQAVLPARSEFVALPASDRPTGEEALRVIRLELSGNTLRFFGAPVNEETADRRILADFVVGEDGTPYAVRLVR